MRIAIMDVDKKEQPRAADQDEIVDNSNPSSPSSTETHDVESNGETQVQQQKDPAMTDQEQEENVARDDRSIAEQQQQSEEHETLHHGEKERTTTAEADSMKEKVVRETVDEPMNDEPTGRTNEEGNEDGVHADSSVTDVTGGRETPNGEMNPKPREGQQQADNAKNAMDDATTTHTKDDQNIGDGSDTNTPKIEDNTDEVVEDIQDINNSNEDDGELPVTRSSASESKELKQQGQQQQQAKITEGFNENENKDYVSSESIYAQYMNQMGLSFMASLPLLAGRLMNDTRHYLSIGSRKAIYFLAPKFGTDGDQYYKDFQPPQSLSSIGQMLWQQTQNTSASMSDFMLRHFDKNHDGHITSDELLNMTEDIVHGWEEQLHQYQIAMQRQVVEMQRHYVPETWLHWFSREWPLMDWKVGVFLWRTFGGILLVLAVLTIIPGRLHKWSAKVLRWPVLGLTYFLVGVELFVYLQVRLFIKLAEHFIQSPKHRKLRNLMMQARSYEEWHKYASELDKSQKRDKWLKSCDDETSSLYNWAFIKELMKDMRHAREEGDSLLALAVIQQCTRKNVGGVLSNDLFCYSNAGEPKAIVSEFIDEVNTTLRWITDEALKLDMIAEDDDDDNNSRNVRRYERKFQENVRTEKDRLWKSLVEVTANANNAKKDEEKSNGSRIRAESSDTVSTHSSISEHASTTNEDGANDDEANKVKKKAFPSLHHRDQVLTFLKRARAAYGRTALCLSGGAMMGLYHFGVVKSLLKAGLLPHIISGTSAGSVISAILCTRTDKELENDLRPEVVADKLICFQRPWKDRIFDGLLKDGNLFVYEDWMQLIRWFTRGDTTFLEAYRRTGKILCITLSPTQKKSPPVLLNYLSAPNVTIASAVIASAAVPGFISPVRLQIKGDDGVVRFQGGNNNQAYWDGSIKQDIPTMGLTEMLNCQFFIACQCNPHIAPFFFNPKGGVGMPSRWSSGTQEDSWRGGFLLAALEMYLKNDMRAKMVFLNDVEAAVGFTSELLTQNFEGSTTIVPNVRFGDFFKLFTDPKLPDLYHYFHQGELATYGHISMINLHYKIARTIDDCVAKLESGKRLSQVKRLSKLSRSYSGDRSGSVHSDGFQHTPESIDVIVADLLREKQIVGDAMAFNGDAEMAEMEDDEYETL